MNFIVEIKATYMYWNASTVTEELNGWAIDDLKDYLSMTDDDVQTLLTENYVQDEYDECYRIWLLKGEEKI